MAVFSFTIDDIGNDDLVRRIVLYRLAHDNQWKQFDTAWVDQYQSVVEFPRSHGQDARKQFVFMASEIMHRLLAQGVLAPGFNESNLDLPWFHVTKHGRDVIEANAVVPYDPNGYLDHLGTITSRDVLLAYTEEAVSCFEAGCYAAAVFFLGVACETLLVEIHVSLANSRASDNAPVKQKWDELNRIYVNLPKQKKRTLPEALDIQLGATYNMIRRQRNELGHPQRTPPAVDQRQAFSFFMVFPELVRDVEAFGHYCSQNGY